MNSVKSFKPVKITITSMSGKVEDITAISYMFTYFENISKPFVEAELSVVDAGKNLIKSLPIQGGEEVIVEMNCASSQDGKAPSQNNVTYNFHVAKVINRKFTPRAQEYTLHLLPIEAFANEYSRVNRLLKGHPDEIVEKLLKEELETEREIFVERTKNKLSFFPARKSVVSLINSLQLKSISEKASPRSLKSIPSNQPQQKTENSENDDKISGTAGYFFFQNRTGFVFKSIDLICAVKTQGPYEGSDVLGEYYVRPAGDTGEDRNYFNIERYNFESEIDILDKLRRGVYSTKIVLYNFSTGDYEEIVYSLNDTFKDMVKLGKQSKLPKFQLDQSAAPTRVISMVIDHETWNKEDTIANPEDPSGTGGTEYSDYTKYLIAQSIARRSTLEFQKLSIEVPGNSLLTVGEKVKLFLPNMATGEIRKKEPWDKESSGNYLISKVSHNFSMAHKSGPMFTTAMELIRDTYGMEENPSGAK